MASPLYSYICISCGHSCGSIGLCPRCGNGQIRCEFRESVTIKAGGTVEIPVLSRNPYQTVIKTEGNTHVSFGSATKSYTFSPRERIDLKSDGHWAHIRVKDTPKDGNYLDILFGAKSKSKEPHGHFGYRVDPEMLFSQNRIASKTDNAYFFDKNDGAFVPLEKTIEDTHTGTKVCIKFALNLKTAMIEVLEAKLEKL